MAATEHEHRLTQANHKLLADMAKMPKLIAAGDKMAEMLLTTAGDWGEANSIVLHWRWLRTEEDYHVG